MASSTLEAIVVSAANTAASHAAAVAIKAQSRGVPSTVVVSMVPLVEAAVVDQVQSGSIDEGCT